MINYKIKIDELILPKNSIQSITSQEPAFFVRWGMVIVALIFAVFLLLMSVVVYPFSMNLPIHIQSYNHSCDQLVVNIIGNDYDKKISSGLVNKNVVLQGEKTGSILTTVSGRILSVHKNDDYNAYILTIAINDKTSEIDKDIIKRINSARVDLGKRHIVNIIFQF